MVLHHSAQPLSIVMVYPQEVETHETYYAPLGPKQPPLETRPGVLKELASQLGMESAVCPRSVAPVLTLNALGSEDAPDAPILSYLLQRTLLSREEGRKEGGGGGRAGDSGARVRRTLLATSHAVLL